MLCPTPSDLFGFEEIDKIMGAIFELLSMEIDPLRYIILLEIVYEIEVREEVLKTI